MTRLLFVGALVAGLVPAVPGFAQPAPVRPVDTAPGLRPPPPDRTYSTIPSEYANGVRAGQAPATARPAPRPDRRARPRPN